MTEFITSCMGVVEHDGKFLLVKEGKKRAENLWNLPGGSVEKDENPDNAVKREVEEETGVEVEDAEPLGVYLIRTNTENRTMLVFGYRCTVKEPVVDVPESDTVKTAEFKTQKSVKNLDLRYEQIEIIIQDSENGEVLDRLVKDVRS